MKTPKISWKIYHNPRCSKSREALEMLRSKGIEPQIVEYLKTPPSQKELEHVLELLGDQAESLVRVKEEAFAKKPFDIKNRKLVAQKLSGTPELIERPLIIRGDRAIIARPTDRLEELF
ncbi:MAG TPA: arsenate reductase (glutaredoxin) [Bdellovibrionota bacterium]|jgi:arsenate reductase